ncbi:MAG: plasmid stabilization protein [Acidimicrobiales bacterium]|nr:plasmid stabilization protein [Acidimicrobiales bacterium]
MATLTIRRIDDRLKQALRHRAARHGRSMEAEVRAILDEVLRADEAPTRGLGTRVHQRFADDHVDLPRPARHDAARAADLPT